MTAEEKNKRLENALRVSLEHLIQCGYPRQNRRQYLTLIADALELDSNAIEMINARYGKES